MILRGGLFGYFLFAAYIFFGYAGATDRTSLIRFVLFTLLFSLIGAAAGIAGMLLGSFISKKVKSSGNKYK
jgi:hypothetical protein